MSNGCTPGEALLNVERPPVGRAFGRWLTANNDPMERINMQDRIAVAPAQLLEAGHAIAADVRRWLDGYAVATVQTQGAADEKRAAWQALDEAAAEGARSILSALFGAFAALGDMPKPDDEGYADELAGILAGLVAEARDIAIGLGWTPRRVAVPSRLRTFVYRRDGYACVACGDDDVTRLTIDHRTPVDLGGPTTADNLRTLCKPCNSSKGARL